MLNSAAVLSPPSTSAPFLKSKWVVPALLMALWLWHVLLLATWLHRDLRPLKWDQSVHLSTAWDYKEALSSLSLLGLLRVRARPGHPPYPPLVHYGMVPLLYLSSVTGIPAEDAATYVNLAFIAVLIVGSWLFASYCWGNEAGVAAAFLTSLLPPVVMYARDPLVDLALAGWVVLAYACWMRSEHFSQRKWTLLLGVCEGLGMLSKWSFPFYTLPIAGDAIRIIFKSGKGPVARNVLHAAGLTLLLMLPWYAMNAVSILPRVFRSAMQGRSEGDPAVVSLASWTWYPRLVWWQIFSVGTVVALAGLVWGVYRRLRGFGLLNLWFFSGYIFWSLVSNKNDRYFLPVLMIFPLAVSALPRRLPTVSALGTLLFSAWFTWAPPNSSYALPARPESWPLEEILQRAAAIRDRSAPFALLTLVANHDYLNGNNLVWTAQKLGLKSELVPRSKYERLGQFSEFVLVKTGDLGPANTVARHEEVRREIFAEHGWFRRVFEEAGRWNLPDGSETVLFHRRTSAVSSAAPSPVSVFPQLVQGLELSGLNVAMEPSARYPGETLCRATALSADIEGLHLTGLDLTLDGFWAVEDDLGQPRLLRLRRVDVGSAKITDKSASAFLRDKVRPLKDGRVLFLPDNRIEISGRLGPVPVNLTAGLIYHAGLPGSPEITLKLLSLRVAHCPVPVALAGPLRQYTVSTHPQQGMPFFLFLSGLKTGSGMTSVNGKKTETGNREKIEPASADLAGSGILAVTPS